MKDENIKIKYAKICNAELYSQYMYSYPHKTAYRKLDNIKFADYKAELNKNSSHLYFHIPFCESKCGYCNLFSVTGAKENFIDNYVEAMLLQSMQYDIADVPWQSLTIGGGTPLILDRNQIERLFICAQDILKVPLEETFIGIETSPNQTTYEKAAD